MRWNTYLSLPLSLRRRLVCAQAIYVKAKRRKIGIDVAETAGLRGTAGYKYSCKRPFLSHPMCTLTSISFGDQEEDYTLLSR